MKRFFIYQDAQSQKFWNIEILGTDYTVIYGRLGTTGTTQQKSFDTEETCIKAVDKLIAEKVKKGYVETTESGVSSAKDEAKRFGFTVEEWDEGNASNEVLFKRILNYKNLDTLKHLTIFSWEGAFECDGNQELIDWLIENKDTFSKLETLVIGDMSSEECEISWVNQGDYSKFWQAFPNLKHITIQGTESLVVGDIVSDKLESITFFCGGLPHSIIKSLTYAKTPNLKKINAYLGVADYGFDGSIEDIQELLEKSDFPHLEYLGICNTELGTQVAQAIVNSKYAGQIQTLDISKSIFTDKSAQILLDNIAVFKNLKKLDLGYNYMSEDMCKKIKQLPFVVDVSDRHEYEVDEKKSYYNSPMFTE